MKESISFDRIADRYDATRGGESRGRRLAQDLAPLLDVSRRALEIGVGTGVIALGLRNLGLTVDGLDISREMLALAQKRVGDVLVQGDATRLPIRSSCIEQAYSVWVLHLVADVRMVMDEVVRVLRRGGRYFVMDGRPHNEADDPIDEIWLEFRAALGSAEPSSRLQGYAEHGRSAGLRVVDVVPTGPYPVAMKATAVADNIEGRVQSWMWSIPDDEWARAAPEAIAKLRALPDADRPVTRNDFQEVLILER